MRRIGLSAAACAVLAILVFYGPRLLLPLPLFASDEGSYLIRAIYPDWVVAANPYVAPIINGVHLSAIRAAYGVGPNWIVADRVLNGVAYLAGLVALWRWSTARLDRAEQVGLALLALAFPYYHFAFSNLAEGLFVGALALLCVVTGGWYRTRPIVHALLAGTLAAALVLIKPNGIAVVAALGLVAGLDAMISRGENWRRLLTRTALFGAAFFIGGDLMQWAADEPTNHPLAFFVGDLYGGAIARGQPPHALALAILALGSMASAAAILAGAPIVVGMGDVVSRWRARRGAFVAEGADLVFVTLLGSLAATIAMVTLFSLKIAWDPGSTKLLFGRYFEFFAPLLWLAAAPALARGIGRRTAWACAGVILAGLAGLLVSFQAGIVLFPWDSSVLLAFFHPHPIRAPLGLVTPYRALAVAATGAAALALALRIRPVTVGLWLTLAMAALSIHLDHIWLGPLAQQRRVQDRELRAVQAYLPPKPARVLLLAPDPNDADLGFLGLKARPQVRLGPPAQAPATWVAGAAVVVVMGRDTPPGGPWMRVFQGDNLSVFLPPSR